MLVLSLSRFETVLDNKIEKDFVLVEYPFSSLELEDETVVHNVIKSQFSTHLY
jgi:hypothetical protein